MVEAVADGDTAWCGLLLTPDAARQLAEVAGGQDCPTAIQALSARVVDPREYARPDYDAIPTTTTGADTATTDTCRMTWGSSTLGGSATGSPAPGPQLGHLNLVQVLGEGYQITAVWPCL